MRAEDINITKIRVLENIRQKPLQEDLTELMESIKQNSLLQPIGVKEAKGGYLLIWGFRRLTACKKLGWNTIPAIILKDKNEDLFEEDFLILNATENLQRKDINMVEFGRICHILKKKGMSNTEIAVRLGVPKTRVEGAIDSFTRVPEKHRDKVTLFSSGSRKAHAGKIGSTVSSAITSMRGVDSKEREKIFDYAKQEEMDARLIRVMNGLIKEGMPLKKAMKETKKFKNIVLHFVVRADKFDEVVGKNMISTFFKRLINKTYPHLIY